MASANENVVGALMQLDVSELKKGLQEASTVIRKASSEFKKNTAGMDSWQKSITGVEEKIKTLKTSLEAQEDTLNKQTALYRKVAQEYGKNSQEAQKLEIQINNTKATIDKTRKELGKYEKSLISLRNGEQDLSEELTKTNKVAQKATAQFKKTTAGMVDWKSNADGLGAKLKQLNAIIPSQQKLVDNLAKQYSKVAKKQGENSDEARTLKESWQKQSGILGNLRADVSKYTKSLDDLGKESNDAKSIQIDLNNVLDNLGGKVASSAVKGIKAIGAALAATTASLVGAAESTREYRTDLSKLEANAKAAGLSNDIVKNSLKDLNAITGETDSNIEALSNLMMAGFKDSEINGAVETLSDAVIKFPDTLKVESLADSLQETLQQFKIGGSATGQYAELLERLGYDLDTVQENTNKLNTDEEKRAYLLDLVNQKIGGTTDAYRENNKELIGAADSQFELNDAMAKLGEKAEPAISLVKSSIAGLIDKLLELTENVDLEAVVQGVIDTASELADIVIPPLKEFLTFIIDNKDTVIAGLTGIGAALVTMMIADKIQAMVKAFKAWQLATEGMTIAQKLLNLVMVSNPIGLVVAAITGLVAAFVVLWNKSDAFRKFWINLWDNIKNICSIAWEAIKGFFSGAWDFIKKVWSGVLDFFSGIWEGIKSIFSAVVSWFGNIFQSAWNGIKSIWNNVKGFFSGIWQGIKDIFNSVTSWFGEKFSKAWEAIKKPFKKVGEFFGGIWGTIKEKFTDIGTKVGDAIGGSFKKVINTVLSTAENILNAPIRAINGLLDKINDVPGINLTKLNEFNLPRLATGDVAKKNRPYIALLGDNKKEDEVVSPLSIIRKAVTDTLNNFQPLNDIKRVVNSVSKNMRNMNIPTLNENGYSQVPSASNSVNNNQTINFYQTNNSPKSLNRLEIYKDTKKMISRMKGGVPSV